MLGADRPGARWRFVLPQVPAGLILPASRSTYRACHRTRETGRRNADVAVQEADFGGGGARAGGSRGAAGGARPRQLRSSQPELQGHKGLDPVRYGDWEVKGLASDF